MWQMNPVSLNENMRRTLGWFGRDILLQGWEEGLQGEGVVVTPSAQSHDTEMCVLLFRLTIMKERF